MHRTAPRLAGLLACAALPAAFLTGCSSGSDAAKNDQNGSSATATAPAHAPGNAALAPAKYTKLPDPCTAIQQDTIKQMVPSVKDAGGKPATASDPGHRGGCSWTGLDGYQFRWLDDSFQRFDTVAGTGSAEDQAKSAYQLAARTAGKAPDATTAQADRVGDQAVLVTWNATKDNAEYHYATVVARMANVVVTVDFSGAGLQGDNKPKADEMNQDAEQAAKQAFATLK